MNKVLLTAALLAGTGLAALSMPAAANDDLGGAWSKDRFQVRLRMIDVVADGDGTVNGTSLKTDVDAAVTPEIDLTYYFTKNIAAELIAATSKHDISAGSNDLGDAWILPPTLTLQYHFTPDAAFSPYVGAGINYSMFYGEDSGSGFNGLDVTGGIGYAVQAGADYWLNDNWGLNLDVKYINLDVDVDVNQGATALSADDVDLDPWIFGAGISYKF